MSDWIEVSSYQQPTSSKDDIQKSHLYWEKMEIVYKTFRLIGYTPYKLNTDGQITVSFPFSLWSVLSWTLQITLVVFMNKDRIETAEYWKSYDRALESVMRLLIIDVTLFFILIRLELPKIIKYVNTWQVFTETLQEITISPVRCFNPRRLTSIIVIIAVAALSAIISDEILFLDELKPILIASYFIAGYFAALFTIFWVANCVYIIQMARCLRQNLVTMLLTEPNPKMVSMYCSMWIQLQHKTTELPNAIQGFLSVHMFMYHLSLIFNIYSWMSTFFYSDDITRAIGLLVPLMWILITLMLLCESSHIVSYEVEQKLISDLLSLKCCWLQEEVVKEIELFLDAVELKSSDLVIAGCVTLNRQFIFNMISATSTYIIVLMQFDGSQYGKVKN